MSKKDNRKNRKKNQKTELPKPVQKILDKIQQIPQNTDIIRGYKRPENSIIIEALVKTRNNKSKSSKLLDVDRGTLTDWIDKDDTLKTQLKEVWEELIEWVIDKEFELIEGVWFDDEKYRDKKTGEPFVYKQIPCWRSIQHFLDYQAKHLGYGAEKIQSKTDIKINNSNSSAKQRIILEVPQNGRNTNPRKPTDTDS